MSLPHDLRYMEEALELAQLAATRGEVPVGSVVVYRPPGDPDGEVVSKIIGRGHNEREALQDFSAHAELLAMRRAAESLGSWRLQHCTVYVTLEPCPMCAGAMVLGRVERCVFGASDPKGGFLGTVADLSQVPQLNHAFDVTRGVHEGPCGEVLSRFFRQLRSRRR